MRTHTIYIVGTKTLIEDTYGGHIYNSYSSIRTHIAGGCGPPLSERAADNSITLFFLSRYLCIFWGGLKLDAITLQADEEDKFQRGGLGDK
jgi:hypothetical protein